MSTPLYITPLVTLPAGDLRWEASRSSGSGGQNVNKVSSRVTLRFDVDGTQALDEDSKERLRRLDGVRLDADGQVMVISQLTRDQGRNLEDAREKLAALVLRALQRPRLRVPTRPRYGAVQRRLSDKQLHSARKRERRAPPQD